MANLRTDTGSFRHDWRAIRRLGMLLPLLWPLAVSRAEPAAPGTAAAPQEMVVDVQIRGNKSLPLEKILPHIRTRAGRIFDLEQIEEDVRRLDHTHMFVNVRTFHRQAPGGQIVIFDLLERPLLKDVLFVGCKEIRKKTLQKEADLKAGDPVDPFAIEEARRKLEEYYRTKGFSRARITLLEGNKPEDRRAVFLINEGTKQRVWNTAFIGNTISSDDRLRTQIGTSRPFFYLLGGEFDRKKLDEDKEKLTAYYRGLGFFRARIGCEVEGDDKWVNITFVIDEGPRYKIRNVSVLGNTKYASDELLSELKLTGGEYFNQSKMIADRNKLTDKYGGIGYVFADVTPDPRFLEEAGQLDLVYNIKEGDRYRVGKIHVNIKGEYPHTKLTTVLDRLSTHPGDIVDIREIRASERRLRASQLFEANPATGNPPKITFSPPDQEGTNPEGNDKTGVARRPKSGRKPDGINRGTGSRANDGGSEPIFRGQSPEAEGGRRRAEGGAENSEGGIDKVEGNGGYSSFPPSALRPPPSDDLMQMAGDLRNDLAQSRAQRRPPARLILTQYAPDAGQTDQASQPSWLKWYAPTPSTEAQKPQSASTSSSAPTQPAPAYGQQMWPRQGGTERPVETPQGTYAPGPIFSENSPFRDGPPYGGDPPRDLDLNISAEETMTGRIMFGVGINSDAGLVGSIILDEQNFDWTRFPNSWEDIRNATAWRGDGQRFRLEAVPGTQLQRYSVSFQDPYLFDTQVSLGLSGFYFTRIYTQYSEQDLGGRVALGYQFTPDLSGNIAYRGQKINITRPQDPLLPALADVIHRDLALHGFQASMSHDERDSAYMATEGHVITVSAEEVLGSFQYPRLGVDLRKYFTLYERPDGSGRHVLSLAGRADWTGENTPIYERYYAGGFSTIRGFQFRGASPTEIGPSTGQSIFVGGKFMMLASAEYLFPITADDMLRGVVFCDTGTVEPTISNWSNDYRVAPGFGLRISVPAMGPAPIALDFAFPISWQPGDRTEMFSFFMGFGR